MDNQNNIEIQQTIDGLKQLDNLLVKVEQSKSEIGTPDVSNVSKSLSEFVQDSFNVTRKDYEFNQKIQEEAAKRLDEFSNQELIALLTNNKVNDSDRLAKLLAPTFQMLIAKQNAEIQAASQERQVAVQAGAIIPNTSNNASMRELNASASKEVQQGMAQLQNFLNMFMVTPVEVKNDDGSKKE